MAAKGAVYPFEQIERRGERQPKVGLLTERQAAEHCLYFERGCADPVNAFQQWARRAGIPVKYAGRKRLYDPAILDAFLDRKDWTRRHRSASVGRRPNLNDFHATSMAEPRGSF